MAKELLTKRLVLRAPVMKDAESLAYYANDEGISKWLTQMPFPYSLRDAEEFIARQTSGETFAILKDETAIGCIGTHGEFGYWLGRAFWGQGLATEASRAVLAWYFAQSQTALTSGHALGNTRSRNVLLRLGFTNTEIVKRAHKITGLVRDQQVMTLTHAAWKARA